jgi:RNase P/RNase MRP subunit POP5
MKTDKKRFLTVAIEGPVLGEIEAKKLLTSSILEILGENGFSQARFAFAGFDGKKQVAVVKCSPQSLDAVVAALALKRFYGGKDVALRVTRVFGSFPKG